MKSSGIEYRNIKVEAQAHFGRQTLSAFRAVILSATVHRGELLTVVSCPSFSARQVLQTKAGFELLLLWDPLLVFPSFLTVR